MAGEGADEVVLAGRVQRDPGRSSSVERDWVSSIAVIKCLLSHFGHIVRATGVVEHCKNIVNEFPFSQQINQKLNRVPELCRRIYSFLHIIIWQ